MPFALFEGISVHCAWGTTEDAMTHRMFRGGETLLLNPRALDPKVFWNLRRLESSSSHFAQLAGSSRVYHASGPSSRGLLKNGGEVLPGDPDYRFWKANGPALLFASLCAQDHSRKLRDAVFEIMSTVPRGRKIPRDFLFFSQQTKSKIIQEASIALGRTTPSVIQRVHLASTKMETDSLVCDIGIESPEAVKWFGTDCEDKPAEAERVDEWLQEKLSQAWETPEWLKLSRACAGGRRGVILAKGICKRDVAESQLARESLARTFPASGAVRCLLFKRDPNKLSSVGKLLLMQKAEEAFENQVAPPPPQNVPLETVRLPHLLPCKVGNTRIWISPAGKRHVPLQPRAEAALLEMEAELNTFCGDMGARRENVRLALVPECRVAGTCSASQTIFINIAPGFSRGERLRGILAHELAHAAGHASHGEAHEAYSRKLLQCRKRRKGDSLSDGPARKKAKNSG